MFVLVSVDDDDDNHKPQTNHDGNHPIIEPSRFLLMGWEVRGNLEIGNFSSLV